MFKFFDLNSECFAKYSAFCSHIFNYACLWRKAYSQGYHRSTPKNMHAEVRLPKSQKLFNVKALKIGEDQIKRSSRPQSPDFPLKIGEDQKKKVFTSTDRGAMVKFEIGRPCRAGARAVD